MTSASIVYQSIKFKFLHSSKSNSKFNQQDTVQLNMHWNVILLNIPANRLFVYLMFFFNFNQQSILWQIYSFSNISNRAVELWFRVVRTSWIKHPNQSKCFAVGEGFNWTGIPANMKCVVKNRAQGLQNMKENKTNCYTWQVNRGLCTKVIEF